MRGKNYVFWENNKLNNFWILTQLPKDEADIFAFFSAKKKRDVIKIILLHLFFAYSFYFF